MATKSTEQVLWDICKTCKRVEEDIRDRCTYSGCPAHCIETRTIAVDASRFDDWFGKNFKGDTITTRTSQHHTHSDPMQKTQPIAGLYEQG